MKVFKMLFILLTSFYLIILLTGCESKNEEELLKNKAKSEIEYLSANFIKVLNNLNNITFENFNVLAETPTLSKKSASQEKGKETTIQSKETEQQGGQQSGGGSGNSGSQSKAGEQNTGIKSDENSNIVTTQMSPNTILNPYKTEIDWTTIKTDVENLHETWNTIVLDLYKLNVNNENILSFSNDLDKTTTYIKNEDKSNSILAVAKLYSYLPKYMESIVTDNVSKNITLSQSYIINAYSLLDVGDWEGISKEVDKALASFQNVITDIEFVSKNSSKVNKTYVTLNELKNCINSREREIFLIKYVNALEELNTILA